MKKRMMEMKNRGITDTVSDNYFLETTIFNLSKVLGYNKK